MKRNTGARALRGVMEELMLDLMYDLPESVQKGGEYIIDEPAVEQQRTTLGDLRVRHKESA